MNQYHNIFMGVSVNFPDGWTFWYWKNRKDKFSALNTHQSSFEDLPTEEAPQKVLVTAIARPNAGPSIFGSTFEIVALYRPSGIDFKSEFPIDSSEISRCVGEYEVAGNYYCYLDIEKQGVGYSRYMRYYYWQFQSGIWVACVASGSSKQQFREALKVVENLQKI